MTIDLNKQHVTKELLLRKITDLDIYRFYTKGHQVGLKEKILSPLRDEKDPSFGLFIGQSGEICFNDFVLGKGDCIKFVQLKFGLNFFEALSKIAIDFNLEKEFIVKKTEKTNSDYDPNKFEDRKKTIEKANNFKLGKRARRWKARDYAFWLQFGIDSNTLEKYNVEPIDYIFIGHTPFKADPLAYAFIERKDNKETYKIYQPYSKKYKWVNNHNSSIWQGWDQLLPIGRKLIITKSLKDVMAITNLTGIPAVALQSESTSPKNHIIKDLKSRFKQIYILYDNDYDKDINWGRKLGRELSEQFFIPQIEIPSLYKSKDFSDLVKNIGAEEAKIILREIILRKEPTPF